MRGVRIVLLTFVLLLLTLAVSLMLHSWSQEMLQHYIRTTARISFTIFLTILIASPLQQLYPSAFSLWLVSNRRYLGLSFALAHTLHILAIVVLVRLAPSSIPSLTLFVGGIGYLLILAMAITSFDQTAAILQPRLWKRLHSTGIYWNALIFAISFGGRAVKEPFYIPFTTILIGALILRAFNWMKRG